MDRSGIIPQPLAPWQVGVWAVLTAAIFLAWWAWSAKRHSDDFSLPERILSAFVYSISQVIATTLILGSLHRIGWWELGILNGLVTAAVLVRTAFLKGGHNLVRETELFFQASWNLARSSMLLSGIALIALFAAFWSIYLGQLIPPMTIDSWAYHLPWPALVRQEGFLGPFGDLRSLINSYPMNTEILFLWSLVGFGNERWANVTPAIFALASVLACYLLGRAAGIQRREAAISGLMILSVPAVLGLMGLAMVDVVVMGITHVAMAFLARRTLTFPSIIVSGLAAGFLLGAKGQAMYVLVPLTILLVYRLTPLGWDGVRETGIRRAKKAWLLLILFFVLTLSIGSYFYVRNWVLMGNPAGIFEVDIAGFRLFEGDMTIKEDVFNRPDNVGQSVYDALQVGSEWPIVIEGFYDPGTSLIGSNIGGWGAVWTVLMLPAILIALPLSLVRKQWSVLAILACGLAPYFLFSYNHTMIRFHLSVLAAGVIALAYMLSITRPTRLHIPILATTVLLMLASVFLAGPRKAWVLTPEEILLARQVRYEERERSLPDKVWNDPEFADAVREAQKPGNTFALASSLPTYMNYAAWNSELSNRVIWVTWNGSGKDWERMLIENGADAVYVGPASDAWLWLNEHGENFGLVYYSPTLGGIYTRQQAESLVDEGGPPE